MTSAPMQYSPKRPRCNESWKESFPYLPHNSCSQGKVVSTKSTKTAVVAVETFVPHYLYKKRIRKTRRFQAHDEEEKCTVGDYVEIDPSKPISKSKRFTIGDILRKSDL